jgi:dienelactone hydrolase
MPVGLFQHESTGEVWAGRIVGVLLKDYLELGPGGIYSLAPKRIYARLNRVRTSAALWRKSRASPGPRPVDPYMPVRPFHEVLTERQRIVDPSRGVAMDCTIRRPATAAGPLPVVIYSVPMDWAPNDPTPDGAYIAEHLASAGYLAITVRHPDTDRIVFPEYPSTRPDKAAYGLACAEKPASQIQRIKDLLFLLDTLDAWADSGLVDRARIGLSGHSFGGLAAMSVAGQRVGPDLASFKDSRVTAVASYGIMASPPGVPARMYTDVDVPLLMIVGAGDYTYGRWYMPSDKLAAFHQGDAPNRYAVMLDLADHHTYPGGRVLAGKATSGELLCLQWTRSIALAFWDAWICGDPVARRWLDEDLGSALKGDGTLLRK